MTEVKISNEVMILRCQEKLLKECKLPVPQTDTGRQVENTKAREITLVKELCREPSFRKGLLTMVSMDNRAGQSQ